MTAMDTSAIVFRSPRQLDVEKLHLQAPRSGDIEVEVSFSGISTGTERLLWDGSMPAFPGMGYPLVPGYETVGRITGVNDLPAGCDLKVGDTVFVPGSKCFEGVHNLFGGAGARLVARAGPRSDRGRHRSAAAGRRQDRQDPRVGWPEGRRRDVRLDQGRACPPQR